LSFITSARAVVTAAGLSLGAALLGIPSGPLSAQTDLDAFMQQVVARRDDNWKRLQQYVLDEREVMDLRGPGNARLWGEEREYTWFLRDGYFIRSPIRFNGVTIGESERRKEEEAYLARARRRDERAAARDAEQGRTPPAAEQPAAAGSDGDTLTNVDGLIRQTRQPEFVSSAYFLRFEFDQGTYALVGREQFEGREVMRVEYYPTKLYEPGRRGRGRQDADPTSKQNRQEEVFRRVMNKVALVTLWIEPASHQIVKYTFDNINFDFLPGQWLVHVDSARASMTMSQPFKDVWLPKDIEVGAAMTLAIGQFTFRQTTNYHDYREANVSSKVIIK
jgi:hypothetical protein